MMNTNEIFAAYRRRLVAEGMIRSAAVGAAVAFAINTVLAFLYWMLEFGTVWLGAALGLPLGIGCGVLLYFLKYKPDDKQIAGRVDRRGLEERAITMLELSDEGSCMAELQRRDAREHISQVNARDIKFNISPLPVALASAALAFSICLGVLGALAGGGRIPYGKELFAGGADGAFDVVYTVSGGGSVRGEASQRIPYGSDSETVRAIADSGWIFIGWDDGAQSPERQECGVVRNMELKAIFERIDTPTPDDSESDAADDLPFGSVNEEAGGGNGDELGGDNIKDDGDGSGGGKWQDRNQFIDGATYYRDYLELYYKYSTGLLESDPDIPPEIIEFFETYFSGI